jgi:hypothetical protein
VINRTGWRTGKETGGGVTAAVAVAVVSARHDVQCVQVASACMPSELLKMKYLLLIFLAAGKIFTDECVQPAGEH